MDAFGFQKGNLFFIDDKVGEPTPALLSYATYSDLPASQPDGLSTVSTTTPKRLLDLPSERFSCQLTGEAIGPFSIQAVIEVSNDNKGWCSSGESTFLLEGDSLASKAFFVDTPWAYIRARVLSISGTDANLTVTLCTGTNL